ncbi:MAG: hypothetical protein ISS88_00075 [Candidatus Portnoybacteria bacterium]|nr:hypothetical protein [Candidatus Portnoybacteria bacterium]
MAFKLFSQDSTLFPQEKKQQLLIIVLITVALAVLFVLYFGFLRPSPPGATREPGAAGPAINGKIFLEDITKRINFDIDFLKEPYFQTLKIHGEWPLPIEGPGRNNPFLSY